MRKRRPPEEGFVKQEELLKVQESLAKKKKSLRVSRGFTFLFVILFIISTIAALMFSLELYHWNPFEPIVLGFTTSISNTELQSIAKQGKKVEITGYITTGYNDDVFITSKPYSVPYYMGSDEMALYRNIMIDTTGISNFNEGDLVTAEGYLTYDNYVADVNGTTYKYKLKLTNATYEESSYNLGSYYDEYKKYQDAGALTVFTYANTWMDYVITGCYYENYEGIEVLDTTVMDSAKEKLESVASELSGEYKAALDAVRDAVDRTNLLIEAKDWSTIVSESTTIYSGFDKFDMLMASVDISNIV